MNPDEFHGVQSKERYPAKSSAGSSHEQILKLCVAGGGARLLDVGCSRGYLMNKLRGQNWTVVGIEPNSDDAKIASQTGFNVFNCSAEEALKANLGKYDRIIFADVLEHLVNPTEVLQAYRRHLTENGTVVISVPNIAHLSVRAQLMVGLFNMTDSGILDRTHLHFYTQKTLIQFINECGFSIVKFSSTPAPIEKVFPILASKKFGWLLAFGSIISRIWPTMLGYQFIVVASLDHSGT